MLCIKACSHLEIFPFSQHLYVVVFDDDIVVIFILVFIVDTDTDIGIDFINMLELCTLDFMMILQPVAPLRMCMCVSVAINDFAHALMISSSPEVAQTMSRLCQTHL